MMMFTQPVKGRVTADFDEEREDRIHGAIDIAPDNDISIRAPEEGRAFAYIGIRYADGEYWPEIPVVNRVPFLFANYFYDMYGAIIVLKVAHGKKIIRTHILAHCYGKQIFSIGPFSKLAVGWVEESEDKRFPIHGSYTAEMLVKEGQVLGRVGNSGKSTGPHVHWEVHHGYQAEAYADRINPEATI